jgi:hypothetical protein
MKYSENNTPIICMMTNSTCYKNTKTMTIKGVLWHSTGANNSKISRYVQPTEGDPNYDELIKIIGKNKNGNDWNHISKQAGVNAWVGKLADGSVATVQTLPWNYRPWGCGTGRKGSCNDTHINFEICEDGLADAAYFNKVYKEACELTAYLCKKYNIDPNGTIVHNGVTVPTILCHADSYKLGLGSNHGDVLHWFKKHGKTMDDVRKDVAALLNPKVEKPVVQQAFTKGQKVKLVTGAKYSSGKSIPSWVFKKVLYVRGFSGENVIISTLQTGAITGTVNPKYLVSAEEKAFEPYKIKVTTDALRIRSGAGVTYKIVDVIRDKGVYTIIEEKKVLGVTWGKLRSGLGWICLTGYTKRV